jgi:two-component system OmpR family sensor kinase
VTAATATSGDTSSEMEDEGRQPPSFRLQLAIRITNTFTATLLVAALAVHVSLKSVLIGELDRSLSSVASVQASAIAQSPADQMRLHEWRLSPDEAAVVRDVNWLVEVWDEEANPLLRTTYLRLDLPLDSAAFDRAQAGDLVYVTQRWGDTRLRVLYYPIDRIDTRHRGHVLEVASSLAAVAQTMRRIDIVRAALALLAIVGTAASGWRLAGHAREPVQRITEQAEGIEVGSLDRRITAHAGTAEFQGLGAVLNRMLNRLDRAFSSQKRFLADASHELRSPIAAVRGHLEVVRRRERSQAEYEAAIDVALGEVTRLQELAEDLLTLARKDAGVLEPRMRALDLAELAAECIDEQRAAAQMRGLEIRLEALGGDCLFADPDLLRRVVRNLVENAIKFTPTGGEVLISIGGDGTRTWLEVADTGPGIEPVHLQHIFQPFYRGDEALSRSSGAGLGLAIAQAIIQAHGGRLSARNSPVGGAAFRLELDAAP